MINLVLNKDSDIPVKVPIIMDPIYEQILEDIRNNQIDAKYLSLPLTDPGWQILLGREGGAYQGPPTISYLAGKRDFAGYESLAPFSEYFLKVARQRDFTSLDNLFTFLNIGYVFYNSDPFIYDDVFSSFPYQRVRDFLPSDQKSYQQFIEQLPIEKKKDFADTYHIYSVKDHVYLPHVYAAKKVRYWNNALIDPSTTFSFIAKDKRIAVYAKNDIAGLTQPFVSEQFFEARNESSYQEFFKNRKPSKFPSPHISRELSWPIYPLVVWREKEDLKSYKVVNDEFIDRSIFYAEKRINELERWRDGIKLLDKVVSIKELNESWKEPTLFEFQRFGEYNAWEINFLRYMREMLGLIDKIEQEAKSNYSVTTNKVELKRVLFSHKQKIQNIIKDSRIKKESDKKYLLQLVSEMFDDILQRLNLEIPQSSTIPYRIDEALADGTYDVYVEKEDIEDFNQKDIFLTVSGTKLYPQSSIRGFLTEIGEKWVRFDDLSVSNDGCCAIDLSVNSQNLVDKIQWKSVEQISEGEDGTTFTIESESFQTTHGLTREISKWSRDSLYLTSFDYHTYGREFEIEIYEGGKKKNGSNRVAGDVLRSKEWKSFQMLAQSGEEVERAFLRIKKLEEDALEASMHEDKPVKIEIRNLSVRKIPRPRIVLKNASGVGGRDIPKIKFTKVNPTKYTIKIEGAYNPYTLVFLDAFHPRWKLFLSDTEHEAKSLRGGIARFIGKTAHLILSSFSRRESDEETVVASYFGGEVREGIHKNMFLDSSTFQTWGMDPIAESRHYRANGYANAWQIEPEDTGKKADYTLILEMTTQKSFYGMFSIALLTFITLTFYFIILLIRNR